MAQRRSEKRPVNRISVRPRGNFTLKPAALWAPAARSGRSRALPQMYGNGWSLRLGVYIAIRTAVLCGGVMPSHHLIRQYADLFDVENEWRWSGTHYHRTAVDWLANFDAHRDEIGAILKQRGRQRHRAVDAAPALVLSRDRRAVRPCRRQRMGVSHYRMKAAGGSLNVELIRRVPPNNLPACCLAGRSNGATMVSCMPWSRRRRASQSSESQKDALYQIDSIV
jgi:hypothetical protein